MAIAFSLLFFVVVLGGSMSAGIIMVERGMSVPAVLTVGVSVPMVIIALCERLFPYRRTWSPTRGELLVDVGHLAVSGNLTLELTRPLVHSLAVVAAAWLADSIGYPLWPGDWPIMAQLGLALVVGEFFMYWLHRWRHTIEVLWRFHTVHHSPDRLYFLNSSRFHPIDMIFTYFSWYIPFVLMGAGSDLLVLFGLFIGIHALFQHGNLNLRLGPLNWIFSSGELHRWHHMQEASKANSNYGQSLIIWDVVFGTRYFPAEDPQDEVGLESMPQFPTKYLAQLLAPFRLARIKTEVGRLDS